MKVANDRVITMHYTLSDENGAVIDSSRDRDEPFVYLHGHGNIIGGLESALEGTEEGFASEITVTPEEGYGERNEQAVFQVPKEQFPAGEDIQVGMQVQGEGPQGVVAFTVADLTDNGVILDGNHPLAGKTLHFDVEVLDVREATSQELEHGHAHAHGNEH